MTGWQRLMQALDLLSGRASVANAPRTEARESADASRTVLQRFTYGTERLGVVVERRVGGDVMLLVRANTRHLNVRLSEDLRAWLVDVLQRVAR